MDKSFSTRFRKFTSGTLTIAMIASIMAPIGNMAYAVAPFTNDVDSWPTQSDSIQIDVTGVAISSVKWGYSPDNVCDVSDSYPTSFDTINPTDATVTFIKNTETNNTKYICVEIVDGGITSYQWPSGNSINIDVTPSTISIVNPTTAPAQSKTVTASADGGATVTMAINAAGVTTCDGTLTFGAYASTTFSAEADNTKSICYKAVDTAGNISYLVSNAIGGIDVTPPTVAITSFPNVNIANSGAVTLTGTCSENGRLVWVQVGTVGFNTNCNTGTWTSTAFNLTDAFNTATGATADHTDAAGNPATQATSTNTRDVTAPIVTIVSSPNSVNSGATSTVTFTLSESSSDFGSGDIVVVWGTLSGFAATGTGYTATFTPTPSSTTSGSIDVAGDTFHDVAGNGNTPAIQNLITVDTLAPTVTISSFPNVNIANSGAVTLTGSCSENGRLVWVQVGTDGQNTNCITGAWSRTINLSANTATGATADHTDAAGNPATQATSTNTRDVVAPVTVLTGSGTMTIAHGSVYADAGASWSDNRDGTGALSVASSGTVNTAALGIYTLQYWKVDALGNTGNTVTRTVTVTDQTSPVVTLSGASSITLAFGATYTEAGASWTDAIDGTGNTLTGTYGNIGVFQSSGTVNTSVAGTYTITYKKIDAAGNIGTATRTVTVNASVISGGGSSSSSSTPIISSEPITQSGVVVPPQATITPTLSSNPNISQDTFVKKISDIRKSPVLTTKTTLKAGTIVNIFKVLPNGKEIKIGSTRVLRNGNIRYPIKVAGKFHIVQK